MEGIWHWAVAGLGTIIVGLLGVWANHRFGPKKKNKNEFPGPDKLIEMMHDHADSTNLDPTVRAAIAPTVVIAQFSQWLLAHGKDHQIHEYKVVKIKDIEMLRGMAGPKFTDELGRSCRDYTLWRRTNGKWTVGVGHRARLIDGYWKLDPPPSA